MPSYRYTALAATGKDKKGVLEADSERHARSLLRNQGLIPTSVVINTNGSSKSSVSHQTKSRKKIKLNELSLLTRQLATLLAAGLPIEESINGVIEQVDKNTIKTILHGVRSKVLEGHTLANALRQYPNAFSELYCATVGAGEQTGKLDVVLTRLADYTEQQQAMRQQVQQALIYPSLMIFVSIGIISFLLSFVVPKIINVFSTTGQSLPELTQILISISEGLKSYGLYIVAIFVLVILAFKRSLKKESFRRKWHLFLLKMPLIAYMMRSVNTARYARTFGILSAAGVSVLEAMRVSSTLVINIPIQESLILAAKRVKEGANISYALKQTQYFSPMTIHLIASGENSGRLEEMLERAADNQDGEVSRLIATGLTLFEPMIILLMGAIVLFIVLATLLPIFSMDQFAG